MKLFDSLEKQGHVHLAFYGFTMFADAPQFMGTCNCCACCCGILHGPKLASLDPSTQGPQKSNYRAVVDAETCTACGACIKRCPVNAIAEGPKRLPTGPLCAAVELEPGKSEVIRDKCFGCAVCVTGCPVDAIEMEPVSAEEWFHNPSSMAEWEEMRLAFLAAEKK
jgi:NAD-dependent dihydropyrimidine dehydrogenase PreA subunit